MPERLTWRAGDVLRWATGNGADALGLGGRVGSLTPGKEADLIVVGGPAFGAWPVVDPEASLVFQATKLWFKPLACIVFLGFLLPQLWTREDGA